MAIRADRVGVREDQVDIHGRVTSPSFFNELLEDLPEWTDMPVWVNGTEELLPSNNSAPVTSPILADIAYPDIRRDNQYFTYRESPTPVDGLAKIKSIKGNTLKWNQLLLYIDSSGWQEMNSTTVFSSNEAQCTSLTNTWGGVRTKNAVPVKANNKYLVSVEARAVNSNESATIATGVFSSNINIADVSSTTYNRYSVIVDNATDKNSYFNLGNRNNTYSFAVKNVMLFNLTAMFGAGNEPTTVEELSSLFPLVYYVYNAGTLLSFNGTGIKTVGKNLFNSADVITGRYVNDANGVFGIESNSVATNYIEIIPNTEYKIISAQTGIANSGMWGAWYDENKKFISGFSNYATAKTSPSNAKYMAFTISYSGRNPDYANNVMLLFNGGDETFEPYTSHTTNIPVSTYFPTGMKSAGSVYDELTPIKAITRISVKTFNGSENWIYDSSNALFLCAVSGAIAIDAVTQYNVYTKNNRFDDKSWATRSDGSLGMYYGVSSIFLKSTQFADVNALKTWLQSNPLTVYYVLATPVELPTMSFE